jgi:hypothetical protein
VHHDYVKRILAIKDLKRNGGAMSFACYLALALLIVHPALAQPRCHGHGVVDVHPDTEIIPALASSIAPTVPDAVALLPSVGFMSRKGI